MTVQECYDAIGGDYADVMSRMLKDERVKKFAGMFLREDSYNQLVSAIEAGDAPTAFRAAHTLKGVTQNLGLAKLATSVIDVTEALRNADTVDAAIPLMDSVKTDYALTVEGINRLLAE